MLMNWQQTLDPTMDAFPPGGVCVGLRLLLSQERAGNLARRRQLIAERRSFQPPGPQRGDSTFNSWGLSEGWLPHATNCKPPKPARLRARASQNAPQRTPRGQETRGGMR